VPVCVCVCARARVGGRWGGVIDFAVTKQAELRSTNSCDFSQMCSSSYDAFPLPWQDLEGDAADKTAAAYDVIKEGKVAICARVCALSLCACARVCPSVRCLRAFVYISFASPSSCRSLSRSLSLARARPHTHIRTCKPAQTPSLSRLLAEPRSHAPCVQVTGKVLLCFEACV